MYNYDNYSFVDVLPIMLWLIHFPAFFRWMFSAIIFVVFIFWSLIHIQFILQLVALPNHGSNLFTWRWPENRLVHILLERIFFFVYRHHCSETWHLYCQLIFLTPQNMISQVQWINLLLCFQLEIKFKSSRIKLGTTWMIIDVGNYLEMVYRWHYLENLMLVKAVFSTSSVSSFL